MAFNGTSNQTTRATDEDRFKPKARSFSLFGFLSDLLSGSFAARAVLGAFEPEAVPKAQLEVAPHREKRTLAIFDLVSGALTHWILPEGLIKNTDELANQTSPAFTPLSIQLIQASRNVVSTKEAIQHKLDTEVPAALEKEIIENIAYIMANTAFHYDAIWHPADIWLVALMIVLVTSLSKHC